LLIYSYSNSKMQKIIVTLISASLLVSPFLSLAQGPIQPTEAPGWNRTANFLTILNNIANWLWAILLVVAAIFILIAAYNFVTAGGDADKVTTARNFVIYAMIGVLIGFLAKALVIFAGRIAGTTII